MLCLLRLDLLQWDQGYGGAHTTLNVGPLWQPCLLDSFGYLVPESSVDVHEEQLV